LDLRVELGGSKRRLWALARGLPKEAVVWVEDLPDWTRQDEFSARTIEALEHWGPMVFLALTRGKGKTVQPARLFEHPDRPSEKTKKKTNDIKEISRFFGRLGEG
jgi:hypothetical protein